MQLAGEEPYWNTRRVGRFSRKRLFDRYMVTHDYIPIHDLLAATQGKTNSLNYASIQMVSSFVTRYLGTYTASNPRAGPLIMDTVSMFFPFKAQCYIYFSQQRVRDLCLDLVALFYR